MPGYDFGDWREPRPGALEAVQRRIDEDGGADPAEVAARLGQARTGYGAYQTFGDLWLEFPGSPGTADEYRRHSTSATPWRPWCTPPKGRVIGGSSSPRTPIG